MEDVRPSLPPKRSSDLSKRSSDWSSQGSLNSTCSDGSSENAEAVHPTRPVPAPRFSKLSNQSAKPVPAARSKAVIGHQSPTRVNNNDSSPSADISIASIQRQHSTNCYEDISEMVPCNANNNASDGCIYELVSDPKPVITQSFDFFKGIKFDAPGVSFKVPNTFSPEDSKADFLTDISVVSVSSATSNNRFSSSDNEFDALAKRRIRNDPEALDLNSNVKSSDARIDYSEYEIYDIAPPSYPPPPPPPDYDCRDFDASFFDNSSPPVLPPRPEFNLHVRSEIQKSFDAGASEIKQTECESDVSVVPNILPPPSRKAPLPPNKNRMVKMQPPKPPRKCLSVEKKITRNDFLPFKDYLYITGSHFVKQEFLWRWCIMEQFNELLLYEEDNEVDIKGEIEYENILSISLARINKQENLPDLFCFTANTYGKQYLFGVTLASIRNVWMIRLVAAFGPNCLLPSLKDWLDDILDKRREFCRAGHIFLKEGISGTWQKVFFLLQHHQRLLHICFVNENEVIDLRKVMKIKLHEDDNNEAFHPNSYQIGSLFHIDLPGRAIYMHSDVVTDTVAWYNALNRCLTFGSDVKLNNIQLTQDNVPVIVDKLIKFVSTHGGTCEGIYRLAAPNSKIKALLDSFVEDAWSVHLKPEDITIHEASSAVKRFCRSLDDCVFTDALYESWITASSIRSQNDRLLQYKKMLKSLPPVNYATLKAIIGHLLSIDSQSTLNKMTTTNLGPIFGPSLLYKSDRNDTDNVDFASTSAAINVVVDVINFYPFLFEVEKVELEKEKKIQQALEQLRQAKMSQRPAGDILVGIYLYSKLGRCINVRVSPAMTAEAVVQNVSMQADLKGDLSKLAIYEVVCQGDLERPLYGREVVLGVTLRWAQCSDEDARENHLVVKPNSLYSILKPQLQQPKSLFSELRYAEGKSRSLKKALFEFSGARLSYYKDARNSNVLGIWNIEDVTWYLGCETKRLNPTRWAFTFIERNIPFIRTKENPYFGITVSCGSEEEYHRWLAAMLVAEYPSIIKTI
ncbi:Uncharacterised protein g6745 [Pycnogonum litorale]